MAEEKRKYKRNEGKTNKINQEGYTARIIKNLQSL